VLARDDLSRGPIAAAFLHQRDYDDTIDVLAALVLEDCLTICGPDGRSYRSRGYKAQPDDKGGQLNALLTHPARDSCLKSRAFCYGRRAYIPAATPAEFDANPNAGPIDLLLLDMHLSRRAKDRRKTCIPTLSAGFLPPPWLRAAIC